jgi:hypothetical protein
MLKIILIPLFLFFISFQAVAEENKQAVENRPSNWAQPVKLDGAPNLHKVTDKLYRSAQPSAEGMKNLKNLGIKTIINLRAFHSESTSSITRS